MFKDIHHRAVAFFNALAKHKYLHLCVCLWVCFCVYPSLRFPHYSSGQIDREIDVSGEKKKEVTTDSAAASCWNTLNPFHTCGPQANGTFCTDLTGCLLNGPVDWCFSTVFMSRSFIYLLFESRTAIR